MKKLARANLALTLARAIYANREAHRADLALIRHSNLSKPEKFEIVKRMAGRAGHDAMSIGLPASVLYGVERLLAHRAGKK